jgi:hypothetical protein
MRSVDDEQRGDLLLFDPRTGAESVVPDLRDLARSGR